MALTVFEIIVFNEHHSPEHLDVDLSAQQRFIGQMQLLEV